MPRFIDYVTSKVEFLQVLQNYEGIPHSDLKEAKSFLRNDRDCDLKERVELMALPGSTILFTNRGTQNHFSPIKQNFVLSFCTMVKEVNPETLKAVLDSWEGLKNTEDYKKQAGEKVMKL